MADLTETHRTSCGIAGAHMYALECASWSAPSIDWPKLSTLMPSNAQFEHRLAMPPSPFLTQHFCMQHTKCHVGKRKNHPVGCCLPNDECTDSKTTSELTRKHNTQMTQFESLLGTAAQDLLQQPPGCSQLQLNSPKTGQWLPHGLEETSPSTSANHCASWSHCHWSYL